MYKMCMYSLKSYKTNIHLPTILPEKEKHGSHSSLLGESCANSRLPHRTCSSPGNLDPGFCINHVFNFTISAIMYK